MKVTTAQGVETGVMHACGHDIHMASWIGTARRLSAMKAQWSGTLVMVAQPAEKTGFGACTTPISHLSGRSSQVTVVPSFSARA